MTESEVRIWFIYFFIYSQTASLIQSSPISPHPQAGGIDRGETDDGGGGDGYNEDEAGGGVGGGNDDQEAGWR